MSLFQGECEISRDYIYLAHQDFSPMPRDFFENTSEEPPLTAKITLPDGLKPVLFSTDTVEAGKSEAGSTQWILHASGWSLILYAGDYISEHIDAAGLNVEFFYSAKHRRVRIIMDLFSSMERKACALLRSVLQAAVMLPEEPVSWARTASVKQGLRIP